jgi:hypothetical protein
VGVFLAVLVAGSVVLLCTLAQLRLLMAAELG